MPSDVVLVALIAATPGIMAVVLGFINRNKLTELHLTMNSRLDELVKAKESVARAAGAHDERMGYPKKPEGD